MYQLDIKFGTPKIANEFIDNSGVNVLVSHGKDVRTDYMTIEQIHETMELLKNKYNVFQATITSEI